MPERLKDFLGDLYGPGFIVVLGCLVCQMGLGFGYVLGPLAGDVIGELGWTRAMYSSARAPQLFVISLTSPLIGFMVVRYGSRRILLFAILILAVAFLLLARIESLWQLYALVMLQGLAVTGLGDITVGQLTSAWIKRGRGLALGLVYTGSNIGGSVLVAVAGWVAVEWSWREAFAVMGLAALVVMLPIAWLTAHSPPPSLDPHEPASAQEDSEGPDSLLPMRGSDALRTRSFWILTFSLFTFFFYFLGMIEHLVLFLTDNGMVKADAYAHFRNALAMGIASKIGLGLLADRIPHRLAIALDYALLAVSSMLLLLLPSDIWIWGFVVTYGFATAARDVVYPLIITYCFGLTHMAEIYGLMMLALVVGGATGPLFAAAMHDHFGDYTLAFRVFVALNVVAAVSLVFLRDERRQPRWLDTDTTSPVM